MTVRAPRLSPSTILRYERLEGLAGQSLEDLLRLIAQLLGVERCVVGLMHPSDDWLRILIGVPPKEARNYVGFCAYAMLQDGPTFLDDARATEELRHMPLVRDEPGVRLFAGIPITTSAGVKRGALVLLDPEKRVLSPDERSTFLALANQVRSHVELHTGIEELRKKHLGQIGALSMLKGLLKAATTFAIIGTDPNGQITLFSEGAERVLGLPARDALGGTPLTYLDPRELRALGSKLGAARGRAVTGFEVLVAECEGDAPVERTWTMRRADGVCFPGVLIVAPVLGEEGLAGYAFIARDITEQRAVESMKDDFVSMVSHELRTPLTAIRGALGLAAGGVVGEIPEALGELLHIAHANSERLLRIVNDILDIHRLESGALDLELEPTDVLAVVQRAVELTRPFAADYDVTFRVPEGAESAPVMADFERLVQVLFNLASNAVKYSPKGGRVDIDVVRHPAIVRITVTDTGPGIPDDFRDRIFQKFAQAATGNMRRGGTGLGLSIVKSLVELHGGRVGFDTLRGKGTTFYVDLPLHEPATATPPTS